MIISEIGINHEGSERLAFEMFRSLLETSIDGITFQIPAAEYLDGSEPKRCALRRQFYEQVIIEAHQNNKYIGFCCGDPKQIDFLHKAGADFWKTFAWDLTYDRLQITLQNALQ